MEPRNTSTNEAQSFGRNRPRLECNTCQKQNRQNVATLFCEPCMEYLCTYCRDGHIVYAKGNHTFIQALDHSFDRTSVCKYFKCSEHDMDLESHCVSHGEFCCAGCKTSTHRDCQLQEIENITIETLKDSILHLRDTTYKVEALKGMTKLRLDSSRTELQNILKLVNDFTATLTDLLDEVNKLNESFERNSPELPVDDNSAWKNIAKNMRHLNGWELSVAKVKVCKMAMLCENTEKILLNETNVLKQIIDFCHEAGCVVKLRNAIGESCVRELMELFDCNAPLSPDQSKFHMSFDLQKNILLGPRDNVQGCATGIDVTSDDTLVLADKSNKCIYMLDQNLNRTGKPYACKMEPKGVVFVKPNTFLSPANDGINNRKVCLYELHQSRLRLQKTFIPPAVCDAVCVHRNSFIFTMLNTTPAVRKLTVTENRDENWTELGDIQIASEFGRHGCSFCAFDDSSECLFVSLTSENSVLVYSFLRKQTKTVKDGRIKAPKSVAVFEQGIAVVCSSETNSLVCVSSDGEVVQEYPVPVTNPELLAFSRDKRTLFVVSNTQGTIYKFAVNVSPLRRYARQRSERGITV